MGKATKIMVGLVIVLATIFILGKTGLYMGNSGIKDRGEPHNAKVLSTPMVMAGEPKGARMPEPYKIQAPRQSKVEKPKETIGKLDEQNEEQDEAVKQGDNPANGEEELVVYKPSATELEIYGLLANQKILITKFTKKDWGVWCIRGWYISQDGKVPSKNVVPLASGETDWEYTFRVAEVPKRGYYFSGGNHGGEELKDFRIVSGEDGNTLDLGIHEKKEVKNLKIVEETYLKSKGKENKRYAKVQRTYRVFPSKILLEAQFQFISDIYMGTSYVCMLPVSKNYGQFIRFEGTGNVYKTPKLGHTETKEGFENFLGMEEALSATVWGDENPQYKLRAWIGNREMVDGFNNKLKTFYWDLNKNVNKLYFSKFESEAYRRVEKGTAWNHIQGWELLVE